MKLFSNCNRKLQKTLDTWREKQDKDTLIVSLQNSGFNIKMSKKDTKIIILLVKNLSIDQQAVQNRNTFYQ